MIELLATTAHHTYHLGTVHLSPRGTCNNRPKILLRKSQKRGVMRPDITYSSANYRGGRKEGRVALSLL